jgi:thiamine pyrophosphokinase
MLGGLNGRFDHSISQVNNLYDLKDHRYPLYIISDSSLTFLLDKVIIDQTDEYSFAY